MNDNIEQQLPAFQEQTERSKAILRSFSEYESRPIDWLWQNRVAQGKLTIFAGDPSLGKSLSTLDIVARVSRGIKFPDDSPCPEGSSVILTSEDDPADTIKPRLIGLGADMNKVHFLVGEWDEKMKAVVHCSLQEINIFYDVIQQLDKIGQKLRLLVIDPMDSFMGGGDSNCNEDVRKVLDGICNLAERKQFAIIGIKHLNKSNGRGIYRVGGSIAWAAKARAVWMFVKDDETEQKYFLAQKNNLSKNCGGFKYVIETKVVSSDNGKEISVPVFKWGDIVQENVDTFLVKQNFRLKYNPIEQHEILDLLQESKSPISTGDIATKLNKSLPAVSKLLGKLKDKGLVVSPRHGQWAIKNNPSGDVPYDSTSDSQIINT